MVHCSRDSNCHHAVIYQLVSHGKQSINTSANKTTKVDDNLDNDGESFDGESSEKIHHN
jgi:hypothetical protein